MKAVPLTAFPRTLARRGGSKKLRSGGRVPAVIYGGQQKPESLEVVMRDIENLIHHSVSETLLVDLSIQGGTKRLALVQEVQHHALSGKVLHLDLHEVAENEKVTITVPVETKGEAVGVKNGGVLEHVLFKLKVRALPKDLPEAIIIDVSGLEIGKSIHIGEIAAAPGVEILGDKHISVVAVAEPLTEVAEAASAEGAAPAAGEVEMIKEKKDDGTAKPGDKKEEKKDDKKPAAEKKK
jgi:large subunit ribosomal protein L25